MINRITFFILFFCTLSTPVQAIDNHETALKVGSIVAEVGTKVSGFLDVPAGKDKGAKIPVTLINGEKTGPTLSLIGGTHGYEYAPIMALQSLGQTLDPKNVSGKLIIVHIANMESFLKRTIYFNPIDGLNLNRAFPGKANGSHSERVAHTITTQIIKQSDYMVDMHSGDGNESLRPYIYMPKTGLADFDVTIRELAMSFGLDHIIIDKVTITKHEDATFTDMTALTLGIPAMTTEVGGMGSTDAKWVDQNIRGVMNMMRHLEMIKGDANAIGPIVWLGKYQVVTAPETGIFKPSVALGYSVAKGGKIGDLVDFFGNKISTIKAPFSGVINYVIGTPPVSKGEPVAMISELEK